MGCRPARPERAASSDAAVPVKAAAARRYSLLTICSHRGMLTRGDLLRYRIAFALSRASKIIRGLKAGLTEAERYAVADHVVTN